MLDRIPDWREDKLWDAGVVAGFMFFCLDGPVMNQQCPASGRRRLGCMAREAVVRLGPARRKCAIKFKLDRRATAAVCGYFGCILRMKWDRAPFGGKMGHGQGMICTGYMGFFISEL